MKFVVKLIWNLGRLMALLFTWRVSASFNYLKNKLYTGWLSGTIKEIDATCSIKFPVILLGGKYIRFAKNVSIGKRVTLTAWERFNGEGYYPEISIGENTIIGDDSHITAINKIIIGKNVLTGKKITITDNSHGKINLANLNLAPIKRFLSSDGPVIIEDGVWIGDKVTILPNVIIGKNAIVGANAVVTKNVPANAVVGGIPAKIIRIIEK